MAPTRQRDKHDRLDEKSRAETSQLNTSDKNYEHLRLKNAELTQINAKYKLQLGLYEKNYLEATKENNILKMELKHLLQKFGMAKQHISSLEQIFMDDSIIVTSVSQNSISSPQTRLVRPMISGHVINTPTIPLPRMPSAELIRLGRSFVDDNANVEAQVGNETDTEIETEEDNVQQPLALTMIAEMTEDTTFSQSDYTSIIPGHVTVTRGRIRAHRNDVDNLVSDVEIESSDSEVLVEGTTLMNGSSNGTREHESTPMDPTIVRRTSRTKNVNTRRRRFGDCKVMLKRLSAAKKRLSASSDASTSRTIAITSKSEISQPSDDTQGEHKPDTTRPMRARRAAPKSLKEPSVNRKMRR